MGYDRVERSERAARESSVDYPAANCSVLTTYKTKNAFEKSPFPFFYLLSLPDPLSPFLSNTLPSLFLNPREPTNPAVRSHRLRWSESRKTQNTVESSKNVLNTPTSPSPTLSPLKSQMRNRDLAFEIVASNA